MILQSCTRSWSDHDAQRQEGVWCYVPKRNGPSGEERCRKQKGIYGIFLFTVMHTDLYCIVMITDCYLQGKLVPRSSSPVSVYVELPCITEQGMRIVDIAFHYFYARKYEGIVRKLNHADTSLVLQLFQQSHGMIWKTARLW